MTLTYGNVRQWDPAGITTASTELRAELDTLEKACDELEAHSVPGSWVGFASAMAKWRTSTLVGRMSTHVEETSQFERAIFNAESEVSAVKRSIDAIDADARAQDFEISADGTVTDVSPPQTFESARAAEHHSQQRVALRDALVDRVERVLERAHEIDAGLLWTMPRNSFSDGAPEADDPTGMGDHTPLDGPVPLDDEAFDLSEIMQGQIGDCWFLASAGAVGAVDPDWIRDHLRYNPDGSYTVTLYQDGEPVDVRVDASTIEDGASDSDDGSPTWLSIYEKAAASLMGGSYDDIDADQISRGLEMVTGRDVESDGDMGLDDIRGGIEDGRIHVVSTEDDSDSGWNPFDTAIDDDNIVPNHAYIIDRVEDIDGDGELEVHVVNPWGPDGGTLDGHHRSGDLWLSEDEFHDNFDSTSSIGGR